MKAFEENCSIGIFFGRPERSHILASELRARGFEVTLYNRRGLPGTFESVPYAFWPALLRLLRTRHDVYVTSLSFAPSLCLRINQLLRRAPYVFNATGVKSAMYRDRARRWRFPALAEGWLYPALMNQVLAGAGRIVCNSRYLQDELARQFPRHAHKMMTIYNGIDFDRFTAARRGVVERGPDAAQLVSTMTWDYAGKAAGARLLIDAMERVYESFPGARLVIAAKASHARYAVEIEEYLAARRCRGAVSIVYNQPDIAEFLAGGDLFVYATPPGSNDSLPRALLEAHAAGLPVVTTATAGCPEIVRDGETGFVTAYEPGALAERVMALLSDPGTCERFGRRGRERAREIFAWERMADAYAAVFREVAAERAQAVKAKGWLEARGEQR